MRVVFACLAVSVVFAADPGVPPRASAKDYPVQAPAPTAKIAAAIVPLDQVSKMFTPDIAKNYIVVEVAIYPENGVPFDVEMSDFSLRVGKRVGRADNPSDVPPWPERTASPRHLPVDVTVETGIAHESDNDPVYGRHSTTGTYTGVAVSAPAHDNFPPPPDPRVDPRLVYDRLHRMALPQGDTLVAIAGYLYFPQYAKRKKSDEVELKYARDDVSLNLLFPK
jgi:hypothetical protein